MINVVILGRPNVGKSTLFNRLLGKRKSIVEATPGVTRDVNRELINIDDLELTLYDTGGLLDISNDELNDKVRTRALKVAASEADILIFVVSAKESHPDDLHFLNQIRKFNKPIILAINKVDSDSHENLVHEFNRFGIKHTLAMSAEHSRGIGELVDLIVYLSEDIVNELPASSSRENEITIAIVGKPNAGKSTLLNTLTSEDLSIVSPEAGTTRDTIDARIEFDGVKVCLIDTAGIRRKKNVSTDIEYYSVSRAVGAIESADVAILMLDVAEGLTEQDKKIASLIIERRKGIVIAANKWDLRDKEITWDSFQAYMKEEIPVLNYAMYARLCASRKPDANKLLALAIRVAKTRHMKYETHALTDTMVRATREFTITAGRVPFKIFYVTQVNTNPPMFAIFCNHPDKLSAHYRRYLENHFRNIFDFRGTPIVLQFRKRSGRNAR